MVGHVRKHCHDSREELRKDQLNVRCNVSDLLQSADKSTGEICIDMENFLSELYAN